MGKQYHDEEKHGKVPQHLQWLIAFRNFTLLARAMQDYRHGVVISYPNGERQPHYKYDPVQPAIWCTNNGLTDGTNNPQHIDVSRCQSLIDETAVQPFSPASARTIESLGNSTTSAAPPGLEIQQKAMVLRYEFVAV